MTHIKTFETRAGAKDFCLKICRKCRSLGFCSERRDEYYMLYCLTLKLELCPEYSIKVVPGLDGKAKLSWCAKQKTFAPGCKQCKELPEIKINEEHQKTISAVTETIKRLEKMPGRKPEQTKIDYKELASGAKLEEPVPF